MKKIFLTISLILGLVVFVAPKPVNACEWVCKCGACGCSDNKSGFESACKKEESKKSSNNSGGQSSENNKCDGWADSGSSHRNAGNGCSYKCVNGSWSGPNSCDGKGNGEFQGEAAKTEDQRKEQAKAVEERNKEAEAKVAEQGRAQTEQNAAATAEQRAKEASRQQAMVESQRQTAVSEAKAKGATQEQIAQINQQFAQKSQQVAQAQGTTRGTEIVGSDRQDANTIARDGYDPNSVLATGEIVTPGLGSGAIPAGTMLVCSTRNNNLCIRVSSAQDTSTIENLCNNATGASSWRQLKSNNGGCDSFFVRDGGTGFQRDLSFNTNSTLSGLVSFEISRGQNYQGSVENQINSLTDQILDIERQGCTTSRCDAQIQALEQKLQELRNSENRETASYAQSKSNLLDNSILDYRQRASHIEQLNQQIVELQLDGNTEDVKFLRNEINNMVNSITSSEDRIALQQYANQQHAITENKIESRKIASQRQEQQISNQAYERILNQAVELNASLVSLETAKRQGNINPAMVAGINDRIAQAQTTRDKLLNSPQASSLTEKQQEELSAVIGQINSNTDNQIRKITDTSIQENHKTQTIPPKEQNPISRIVNNIVATVSPDRSDSYQTLPECLDKWTRCLGKESNFQPSQDANYEGVITKAASRASEIAGNIFSSITNIFRPRNDVVRQDYDQSTVFIDMPNLSPIEILSNQYGANYIESLNLEDRATRREYIDSGDPMLLNLAMAYEMLVSRNGHGIVVTETHEKALENTGVQINNTTLIPLTHAMTTRYYTDQLGNPILELYIDPNKVNQLIDEHLAQHPDQTIVNMSFQMGTYQQKVELYEFRDRDTCHIRIVDNKRYCELTLDEYDPQTPNRLIPENEYFNG